MCWAGRHYPIMNLRKGKSDPYNINQPSREEISKCNAVIAKAFNVSYQDFTTYEGRIKLLELIWESTHFNLFTKYRYDFEKDDYALWINTKLILGYSGNKGAIDFYKCPAALLTLVYQVICNPPEWREKVPWYEKHYKIRDILIKEGRKKKLPCLVCKNQPCTCHLIFNR